MECLQGGTNLKGFVCLLVCFWTSPRETPVLWVKHIKLMNKEENGSWVGTKQKKAYAGFQTMLQCDGPLIAAHLWSHNSADDAREEGVLRGAGLAGSDGMSRIPVGNERVSCQLKSPCSSTRAVTCSASLPLPPRQNQEVPGGGILLFHERLFPTTLLPSPFF